MRSLSFGRKYSRVLRLLIVFASGIALFSQPGVAVQAASSSNAHTSHARAVTFNAANFHHPARIDNPYFPLSPGTEFLYIGDEGGQALHESELVTHQTKMILGVPTVVIEDNVYLTNGQLYEKTLDWYAQDDSGNVWYFGEYATDYQNGQPAGHGGSWEGGILGAQPGIIMEGDSHVGDAYRQEYFKGVAQDTAAVLSLNAYVCAPYNCYFNEALETAEWSPLTPGFVEQKWYAPGVGFVKSIAVKGGPEAFELVGIKQH
ncbi:MAG: hypothetical protein H0X37_18510 [Herpetosiphonaceae bacterium]|nr:hypothetical protein [Herpetosiphonaceae bacterium]